MPTDERATSLVVLGTGTLGRDLALWAAQRGLGVVLVGRSPARAQEALARLQALWPGHGEGPHLRTAPLEEALPGASAVLEALPEDLDLKRQALARLEALAPPATLLLTGTSSLPLAQLGEGMTHPRRLLGFHLFLPVRRMGLVELVVRPDTPGTWLEGARNLARRLGLEVIQVADRPAASRMGLALGLEAMRLLEEGAASAKDVDRLMVRGYGHPVGPLELSDRVGLDVRLAIARQLFQATGDPRFAPPDILKSLVASGHLGRKSGRGFHDWTPTGGPPWTP
jgi:3-hydroxybutyryl-CoA dehydrogenase